MTNPTRRSVFGRVTAPMGATVPAETRRAAAAPPTAPDTARRVLSSFAGWLLDGLLICAEIAFAWWGMDEEEEGNA